MYCNTLFGYSRLRTREVMVGPVGFGGDNPIRIQSMTTTDTMDTTGTVAQSKRMIDVGCELVRITAPSKKDAENLAAIREALHADGYTAPLVADIHFTPNAAEVAAGIVEKVRVNPGNYADKKKFEEHDYSDEGYAAELVRIEERFTPLVLKCKEGGVAMRIGTNHGSLSDRIMSRYGDTPLGMVESALEFVRICEKHDYRDLVISMKASNPQVMVQAYRLLCKEMLATGRAYPLHLGVTEAGDGEDGRIKSAVGIGALLEDGIGDTIRVSLTEEPEAELPVARMLAERYTHRDPAPIAPVEVPIDPYSYTRRHTHTVMDCGGKHVPRVVLDVSDVDALKPAHFFAGGYRYSVPLDKWNLDDMACDAFYIGKHTPDFDIPGTLQLWQDFDTWQHVGPRERVLPVLTPKQWIADRPSTAHVLHASTTDLSAELLNALHGNPNALLALSSDHPHTMADLRAGMFKLMGAGLELPVVFWNRYTEDEDHFQLYAAADFGALLLDGLGDGLMATAPNVPLQRVNHTLFGVLQATRMRISRTEYISCPSCGRTLFDLQETTARIRERTDHLKGIKIGIMGCIVNGPGEMADADYGYVGTGPGKITLYKEKEVVRRNVPEDDAVDALIDLIREHGDWVTAPWEAETV